MLKEDVKWCEHIHNWGDAWYFCDTYNPFAVSGCDVWGQKDWSICPICHAERPTSDQEESAETSANTASAEIAAEIEECAKVHRETDCDKIRLGTLERWARRLRT